MTLVSCFRILSFTGGRKIIKLHSSTINSLVQQTFIACQLSASHHTGPFQLWRATRTWSHDWLHSCRRDFNERNYPHLTFTRSQWSNFIWSLHQLCKVAAPCYRWELSLREVNWHVQGNISSKWWHLGWNSGLASHWLPETAKFLTSTLSISKCAETLGTQPCF